MRSEPLDSRKLRWLTFLLCVLVLGFRCYPRMLQPEIWAEDGGYFIPEAIKYGGKSLWIVYAGYIDLLQRLVVLICVKSLPPLWWPLAFGFIYIAIFSWVFSLWVGDAYAWLVSSVRIRIAGSILFCLAPGLTEMATNLCNLNWILFFWMAFIGLRDPNLKPRVWEFVLLAILTFSIGTTLLLVPLFVFRIFLAREYRGRNFIFLLVLVAGLVSTILFREKEILRVPTASYWHLSQVFLKTSFDHFVFRPWLGDKLAIGLLRGIKPWRVELLKVGSVIYFAVLAYPLRKHRGFQAVLLLSLCVLCWPVLSWIARPGNLWAFEMPLGEWLLNHRYAFPVGVVAIIFWMTGLQTSPRRHQSHLSYRWPTVLRSGLVAIFIAVNIGSVVPRFWILPYGEQLRWPKLAVSLNSLLKTGEPNHVAGPIYPEGWDFSVTVPSTSQPRL